MRHSKGGYSLIEMMVVIVIIGVISAGVINIFAGQRAHVQYSEELSRALSLVKKARSYAAANRPVYDESQPEGEESYVPQKGYGVYIERNDTPGESKMVLFANTSDSPEEKAFQWDKDDLAEETLLLSKDVVMEGITLQSSGPPEASEEVNRAVILFAPFLGEATLAENGDPDSIAEMPTFYENLSVSFRRLGVEGGASRTLRMNQISGVPELDL